MDLITTREIAKLAKVKMTTLRNRLLECAKALTWPTGLLPL